MKYCRTYVTRQGNIIISHQFTLLSCPLISGELEVVLRECLRGKRVVLSELQFVHRSCPDAIPVVISKIKSSPFQRLGRHGALKLFPGLLQETKLRSVNTPTGDTVPCDRSMNSTLKD